MERHWYVVARNDARARWLADRHYSRKHPGTVEFCPPGENIVLLIPPRGALWVSHRPKPFANIERPRFDGLDYWDNPYFRNETSIRGSDLIREAIAITRYLWRDVMPRDGFHSFVDPSQVGGVKVRGTTVHGFTFMKAGFQLHPTPTQSRGLLRWILPLERLLEIDPLQPLNKHIGWQPALFAGLGDNGE